MLKEISLSVAAGCLVTSLSLHAYEFTKPVHIVVPFSAGGTSDILARLIAPKLSDAIGQPVVVENKSGASGNIGADYVAKSDPDGHTLLLMDVAPLATAPHLYSSLSYDPTEDLDPIVMVSFSPYILATFPDLGVGSLEELQKKGDSDPRTLAAANSGIGNGNHLAAVLLGDYLGIDWAVIPYRGGSDAVRAVVSGESTVLINGSTATKPFVLNDQLTALAVTGETRLGDLPDVPTFIELGLPGEMMGSWQGILATGGSPVEAIERLSQELVSIINDDEMRQTISDQGAIPVAESPESMEIWMQESYIFMGDIVEQFDIEVD